jgi:alkylation response protein AidB-like acyl-CoA dehydrogenase
MDLELSEEQSELRENFRAVLEEYCSPSLVRDVYENGDEGTVLWKKLVELGWPALRVPESNGGLGYGFVEVAVLAEELGRAAAPAPLLSTATQLTPALIVAEAHDELTRVAEGKLKGSLALAERGRWSIDELKTRATTRQGGWVLDGHKDAIVAGANADVLVVVAIDAASSEPGLFLVESQRASLQVENSIDPALQLAATTFDATPARVLVAPSPATRAIVDRVADEAMVAMALHMTGACRVIFETTLEYAKIRKQYDRVIGSFQALKHRFADMYLAVERATALGYFAAVSIAEDDAGRREAVHLAKAAAGDCQRLIAEDGLQLHGGLGFTWEQDLHFWLKRAKAGELLCGSSAWHRAALVSMLELNTVPANTRVQP